MYARVDAVHFLLEHGAHVNAREKNLQTPLHVAASVGCPQVVRILLDHGADVNPRDHHGQLPLHLVSTSTTLEGKIVEDKRYIVAQLLLQHCADVDAQNMCGETPLHSASYDGRLEISWLLLDYGANPHTEDEEGRSPLHHLLLGVSGVLSGVHLQDSLSVAQLLLEHGADANALDKHHATPLHLISRSYEGSSHNFCSTMAPKSMRKTLRARPLFT